VDHSWPSVAISTVDRYANVKAIEIDTLLGVYTLRTEINRIKRLFLNILP